MSLNYFFLISKSIKLFKNSFNLSIPNSSIYSFYYFRANWNVYITFTKSITTKKTTPKGIVFFVVDARSNLFDYPCHSTLNNIKI